MTAKSEAHFIVEVLSDETGEKLDEWEYTKEEYLRFKTLKKQLKIHRWQTFFTHLIRVGLEEESMRS